MISPQAGSSRWWRWAAGAVALAVVAALLTIGNRVLVDSREARMVTLEWVYLNVISETEAEERSIAVPRRSGDGVELVVLFRLHHSLRKAVFAPRAVMRVDAETGAVSTREPVEPAHLGVSPSLAEPEDPERDLSWSALREVFRDVDTELPFFADPTLSQEGAKLGRPSWKRLRATYLTAVPRGLEPAYRTLSPEWFAYLEVPPGEP